MAEEPFGRLDRGAREEVMLGSAVALAALALSVALPAGAKEPLGRPPEERGVALGLFSSDPHYSYRLLLEEIAATGATHVSITWVWWQEDVRASEIARVPGWTAVDAQITESIRAAKAMGLHVTAFPIVRLKSAEPNEWRGRIAPTDEDAWWSSYTEVILHAATISREAGADRLSVGSELLSREGMRPRWAELVDRVRLRAPDLELMYSANWDHFEPVSFWDLVDVVDVTGYWELTKNHEASVDELRLSWKSIKPFVLEWSRRIGRRLVITEIGYPSLDGAAAWPWDETRKAPVDLEEQRRAYEAFVRSWADTQELQGVYFWNWFGFGGADDTNYTPRGKPAARVMGAWYGGRPFLGD